jgi:ABC-type dipeptide/oligopeptide/nickel transport system permease component
VIVESVFSWPGLGSLLVQSVTQRDFNTLVAIVLLTATVFVVTSIVVDLIYWFADPRTRRPGDI